MSRKLCEKNEITLDGTSFLRTSRHGLFINVECCFVAVFIYNARDYNSCTGVKHCCSC